MKARQLKCRPHETVSLRGAHSENLKKKKYVVAAKRKQWYLHFTEV